MTLPTAHAVHVECYTPCAGERMIAICCTVLRLRIVLSHLKALVRRCKGSKSLRQLSQEMWEWELAALQARPTGAVFRMPKKASRQTVARYDILAVWLPQYQTVTLLRYLNKYGIRSLRTIKVPFLSKKHQVARVAFARANMHRDWTEVCAVPQTTAFHAQARQDQ